MPRTLQEIEPFHRFELSFQRAQQLGGGDPTVMALATATPSGIPSVRMVLLKQFDHKGFVFFTHTTSRKGEELRQNPQASLCFFWPWSGEQVRITGGVVLVTASEADTYFATRPRGSRLGAWASQQSQPLASREELLERVYEVTQRFAGQDIPRPASWSGYRVVPQTMEFWQEGPDRLHDRTLYTRTATEKWSTTTLFP